MQEPTIDKETLRRMAKEFNAMPLSESELEDAVPIVQAYVRSAKRFEGIDLSEVVSGRIISLYPEGQDDDR